MKLTFLYSIIFIISSFYTTCAYARNDALLELLKALYENGTIDLATYELVSQVADSDAEKDKQEIQEVAQAETERSTEKIVKEEINRVKSDLGDSKSSIKVGGRIQVDAATFAEDQASHNDGTEIRRARLFAEGNLGEYWGYKLQYDFTATGIDGIQDAYLDYKGIDLFNIRMGHFKEPFSLQNMTSSKYVSFMERGLPYVFAEGRNLGVQASSKGKNWSAAAGLFGDGRDGASSDNDEGFGGSARFTYAPILNNDRILHLGGSISHRLSGSTDTLRFRERPESHLTDTRLVDTGTFDADAYTRIVGESAFVYGPFNLQGEYYHTMVDREISNNPDLDFNGYYVEGGWFLTGESMNYKAGSGSFSRITPNASVGDGGIGAWQVALRYSNLDLTDGDITGGEEDNLTVGVNWFATPNIRFTANYVNVLDVEGGAKSGDEPEVFQLRTQVEF